MTIPARGNLPLPGEPAPKTAPPYFFDVQSNMAGCSWAAVTNVYWISILTKSGIQSGRFQFDVYPNTTGTERQGAIQIGGPGGPIVRIVQGKGSMFKVQRL